MPKLEFDHEHQEAFEKLMVKIQDGVASARLAVDDGRLDLEDVAKTLDSLSLVLEKTARAIDSGDLDLFAEFARGVEMA